jgi:mRNA interferase RelE/StbE
MALYKLEWKNSAIKELKKIPKNNLIEILKGVEEIRNNPFHQGVRKLTGTQYSYRKRAGTYRIIFTVIKSSSLIIIIRIRHRKEAYR